MKLKEVVEVKKGEEVIKVAVVRPSQKIIADGDIKYNSEFWRCYDNGCKTRLKIQRVLKDDGAWGDAEQKQLDELDEKIRDGERKLKAGGIKKSEGREIAVQLIKDRAAKSDLFSQQNYLDNLSAESSAENLRFNFYVYSCTLDNKSGKSYFKSFEDYLEKSGEDEVAGAAAKKLMEMLFDVSDDSIKQRPEYQFLIKHSFMNDSLQFITTDGKPCDAEYRLVDKSGRYILPDGSYCDINQNPVTEAGEPVVEFVEFLDG